MTPRFFGNRHIIKNGWPRFRQATIDWFASLSVDLKREETGKLFPVTDKARTILSDSSIDVARWVSSFILTIA